MGRILTMRLSISLWSNEGEYSCTVDTVAGSPEMMCPPNEVGKMAATIHVAPSALHESHNKRNNNSNESVAIARIRKFLIEIFFIVMGVLDVKLF